MTDFFKLLEKEILPFVEKPARYIGGEKNSIVKDKTGKTRVALIYPDVYEVGISNLGLKILYNILNKEDDISCERAYAPWFDMEKFLREKRLTLFSLETKTPLNEFDILGFSFQYELTITNFLNILDLSNIPLYSEERNTIDIPFIIGGGPILSNPEIVAPFLDIIAIGEGETLILEIVRTIAKGKKANLTRIEILKLLSEIEGCYVPSFYEIKEVNGYIVPQGKKVLRRVESDINTVDFPAFQIVPNIQAVQDRAVIEVSRGCTRGCRFCQAGNIYRPIRERDIAKIINYSKEIIKNTGYRELALLSLSISDYSRLGDLINLLEKEFSPHGISFSLPSLRLDSFTLELAEKAKEIRKTGLTFAVEGGCDDTRNYINKGVNEQELFNVISIAKSLGWKSVKLYFMLGFLQDTEKEVMDIVHLAKNMSQEFRNINITISIAILIPKPHTPFQWKRQLLPDEGKRAFDMLIRELKGYRNINIRYNNPYVSFLEGVLSRGDRRVALAIEKAFRLGARFDGWSEHFNLELWLKAFNETGVNPEFYLSEKSEETIFPWDIIDVRIKKEFLIQELKKADKKELTKDCREKCYSYCGNCNKNVKNKFANPENKDYLKDDFLSNIWITNDAKYIFRFVYTKLESSKYFSTIDVENHFSYSFIRANIGIAYTKGFNPHIKVRTLSALPVGIASEYEIGEVELALYEEKDVLINKLNKALPTGMIIKDGIIFEKGKSKMKELYSHIVDFSIETILNEKEIVKNYKSSKEFIKKTLKGEKVISLYEYIIKWHIKENILNISYHQKDGEVRLKDVIQGLTGLDIREAISHNPVIHNRYLLINEEQIPLIRV
ncbi:MAG: TIGR03960 family B12-binding radical SAM protein [Brevinematales bacterium]